MKPVRDIVAERPLARHCAELLQRRYSERDRAPAIAEMIEEVCQAFSDEVRSLLIGSRPPVRAGKGAVSSAAALAKAKGKGQVHYRMRPASGPMPTLIASFDLPTALALTDRMFGGEGKVPETLPDALPQSAGLAVERIVRGLARVLASHWQQDASIIDIASHRNIVRLEPFAPGEACLGWTIGVEQAGFDPWSLTLTAPQAALNALVDSKNADGSGASSGTANAAHAFAGVPLELTAVLADLQMPIAQLEALQAGQLIPLTPRREIPLRLGATPFAFGALGSLDERVALRLTRFT